MKRTIIAISIITFVFIISTIIVSFSILSNNNISQEINIISLSNVTTKYHLLFGKIEKASEYEINIFNEGNSIIYTQKSKATDLFLDLNDIEYNKKYHLIVAAFNENGENIASSKPFNFVYNEPTFSKDNDILLTNKEDYIVHIDGDLNRKNYYIAICDGEYVVKKERITGNEYVISSKIFTGLKQIFTINLYDNNTVINSYKVYSNISPVSDIKIENYKDGDVLPYEDFAIKYHGGDNATSFILQIFKENTIIKEIAINNKIVIISKDFFKKGEKYTIKIRALYNDISEYSKTDSIQITISSQDLLYSPYINVYPKYYKTNNEITLINPNNQGKIYYTLNGKDPSVDGIEYTESIKLSSNATIRAVVKNKKNMSNISDFNIEINDKDKYSVYLKGNNELSNYIEKKLINSNIVVNRGNGVLVTDDLNFKSSDIYLAVNIEEKQSIGYSIWINKEKTISYSLANLVNNKLKGIYGNNGSIKYAEDSLSELKEKIPLSIVINFTYTNPENMFPDDYNLIGDEIVKQIFDFLGIK